MRDKGNKEATFILHPALSGNGVVAEERINSCLLLVYLKELSHRIYILSF